MSAAIRLTVITDNAERTARRMFGGMAGVPPFVRLMTDPAEVLALPEGTLCLGRWWSRDSAVEIAFGIMRRRGALRFGDGAFYARLDAWLDRRDAAAAPPAAGAAIPASPAPASGDDARGTGARRRGAGWK